MTDELALMQTAAVSVRNLQPAGRETCSEQAVFWCASFKPVMRVTIDLKNKFSEAVTSVSGLMNAGASTCIWNTESISRHPFSERFNRHRDVVTFA